MPYPPITPLPTPPSRSQSPATFSADADAFLGALPDFQSDANALGSYLDGVAAAVDADAADATTSKNAASASATAAAGSATAAATSATNAANSASAALTSANNAAASYDAFDDRYLGAKASNPTTDNDGNPLLTGAIYWNTAANEMRVWNGSAWVATYIPAAGYLTASDIGVTVQGYDADLTAWAAKAAPSGAAVGTTDTQTLTNKTIAFANNTLTGVAPLASPTFTGTVTTATADLLGSVRGNVTTVSASAVDCSAGNYFIKTATGALTWTVTNVPASRAYSFILELTNGGTGTQTWFSGIKWPGGTAPTLTTSGVDVLGFITDDGGTTWRGVQLMKDSK